MKKTISDYVVKLRSLGLEKQAENFHTEKIKDMERLRKSGLPQFNWLKLPYSEFNIQNTELIDFLSKYNGFVIRALPTEQGYKKGFTRRSKRGFFSFEDCKDFLTSIIKTNRNYYDVGITNWEPTKCGGIIISKAENLRAEFDIELDQLEHGETIPFISFLIDFTKLGHISDKTTHYLKQTFKNEKLSRKVLDCLTLNKDSFNPLFKRGYFEFVITKTNKIRFLDYKVNPMYLK